MPEDFEERVHAALDLLDLLDQAERAAEDARARVLAEGGVEEAPPPA